MLDSAKLSPAPLAAAPPGRDSDDQAFAKALDRAATQQRGAAGQPTEAAGRPASRTRPDVASHGHSNGAERRPPPGSDSSETETLASLIDASVEDAETLSDDTVLLPHTAPEPSLRPAPDAPAAAAGTASRRPDPGAESIRTTNTMKPPPATAAAAGVRQADPRGTRTPLPGLDEAATVPGHAAADVTAVAALAPVQRPGPDAGAAPAALPGSWASPPSPAADRSAPLQAELQAPVGSNEFAPALGSRLSLMVRDGIDHAQLRLNPAEMGPIEVRISLDGTQAQVDFSAAHASTRQALQDALPALAGALREQGLTLAGGGVFDQAREQRGDTRQDGSRGPAGRAGTAQETAAPTAALARMPRERGVVDLYA